MPRGTKDQSSAESHMRYLQKSGLEQSKKSCCQNVCCSSGSTYQPEVLKSQQLNTAQLYEPERNQRRETSLERYRLPLFLQKVRGTLISGAEHQWNVKSLSAISIKHQMC